MSYIFSEQIGRNKVILYQSEAGIRIVAGQNKTFFDVLETSIQTYLISSNNLKSFKNIKCTQSVMNAGIKIIICGHSCTVGKAFRLYNKIVELFKLDIPTYGKLFYEQDKATEISPSQIR